MFKKDSLTDKYVEFRSIDIPGEECIAVFEYGLDDQSRKCTSIVRTFPTGTKLKLNINKYVCEIEPFNWS